MTEFQFHCPQCGVELTADDTMCGEVLQCPSCEKGIVVPQMKQKKLGLRRIQDLHNQPTPVQTTLDNVTKLEDEVRLENSRARIATFLEFTKGVVLLLAICGIGYFFWNQYHDKDEVQDTLPQIERPSVSETIKEISPSSSDNPSDGESAENTTSAEKHPVDFDACSDKIVVVGNKGGGGSGFLARMSGKTYFVTNEHVTRNAPDECLEQLLLIDGRKLKLGKFEVAEDQDIVRFEVDDNLPALELTSGTPRMGENIFIYGNSLGGGAATSLSGRILAVGPYRIEVDVEAVSGNSGSPVLNSLGEVIGIFTYVTNNRDDDDWTISDTQFNAVRRWAIRFNSLSWKAIDWRQYRKQKDMLIDIVSFVKRIHPFAAIVDGSYESSARPGIGVHYDEQDKDLFKNLSSILLPRLLKLSAFNQDLLKEAGSSERKRRKILNALRQELYDSAEEANKILSETSWLIKRFETNMKDCLAMKSYQDYLNKMKQDLKRQIEDSNKGKSPRTTMNEVYDDVKGCIGIVRAGNGSGSGFIAKMNGRKYFFTNEHVARGGKPFSIKTPSGETLKVKSFEIADNRDLVRMELEDDKHEALEIKKDDPKVGETIYIFGNSDGGGVLTHEQGKLMAIGPDVLEVQANFIQGNSGSAILNSEGEVLGVATYAVLWNEPEKWVKEGTRYNEVRRYAVRFLNVEWIKMSWDEYAHCAHALEDCERYVSLCREICFRNRKLLPTYVVKEMIQDGELSARELQDALMRIGKSDDELEALRDLYEKLKQKMSMTRKGSIDNPRDKLRRTVMNYPKVRQKCHQTRLSALKAGLLFVNGIPWKSKRLSDTATKYRRFFEFHIRRFKEFFKDDLLGPTSLTTPSDSHSL